MTWTDRRSANGTWAVRLTTDMRGRIREHAAWKRLNRTRRSARLTKYLLGSVVAFVIGNVAFAAFYVAGSSTTLCSVAGFIFAAIPNWILNRRWAWEQSGRPPARQIVGYVGISLIVLVTTSATTGWANHHWHHVSEQDGLRLILVTATYIVITVFFFFAKFGIYEFWVFSERSRVRAAFRSLNQVRTMARANRNP